MAILKPADLRYPAEDERFERIASDMTLSQALAWTSDFPPTPVFNSDEETYMDFVKRQTHYATYRNDVVNRRDELKRKEQQLAIPAAPVGEDISAAINWIQTTGKTPLEYLASVYRDAGQQTAHRITAASKLMEYIHRKMPTTIDPSQLGAKASIKQFDPAAIRSLSEKELAALEKLLEKMK